MSNAIIIKDLSVHYNKICALSNIQLTVPDGDFLCILGPNGGGKSTLLKAILGLIKPTKGSISIYGSNPKETKTIVGYVPQNSTLEKNFPITVLEVVLTGLISQKNGYFINFNEDDRKQAENIMKKLKVHHLKDRQINQLSGGQLKRVLIARTLVMKPHLLLLDEPTTNLDSVSKKQILSLLREINKNATIILVTHDLEVVYNHRKNLIYLNKYLSNNKLPQLLHFHEGVYHA